MDDATVMYEYSLKQAIEDGVLVEVCKKNWSSLSGNKPIVATANLAGEVSLAGLMEIWNEFVGWKKKVEPTLKEQDRLFSTTMNGRKVWVIEDAQALTLMYPEDY
jgi:hypothetical protein